VFETSISEPNSCTEHREFCSTRVDHRAESVGPSQLLQIREDRALAFMTHQMAQMINRFDSVRGGQSQVSQLVSEKKRGARELTDSTL
jgi:hypothetical protein